MPTTRSRSLRSAADERDNGKILDPTREGRPTVQEAAGGNRLSDDEDDEPELFSIELENKVIECERRGPRDDEGPRLIFTHGAGGDLSTPAAKDFARGFSRTAGIVSFKGASTFKSRVTGFRLVVEHFGVETSLGGRSMGARAAVAMALEDKRQSGTLILASYPLQGGGKNDEERRQTLIDLPKAIDVLFIVGMADSKCGSKKLDEVRHEMTAASWLVEVVGTDHGMNTKPKKAGAVMREKTGEIAAQWLKQRDSTKRHLLLEWDAEQDEVAVGQWKAEERVDNTLQPGTSKRKRGSS